MSTLPDLSVFYLITPEFDALHDNFAHFIAHLEEVLLSGIDLVQLRVKTLDAEKYQVLAQQALSCCHRHNARLIVNTTPEQAIKLAADGVHLTSARLMLCQKRPLGPTQLVSAACHDEKELIHAQKIGVDFVTLAPVRKTPTHPDAVPLGWQRFEALAKQVSLPVYALGGLQKADLSYAKSQGAYGIAAIRALWTAPDLVY